MAIAEKDLATAVKVAVPAAQLHRVLYNGALFASSDEVRPVICAVKVDVSREELRVTGTDSYKLGIDRCSIEDGPAESVSVLIDRNDVASILGALKGISLKMNLPVWIEVDADAGTVSVEVSPVYGSLQALQFRTVEGEYPQTDRLIPETFEGLPIIALAPVHLAAFGKVIPAADAGSSNGLKSFTPLKFHLPETPHKPVKITRGDTFVGVLMPVRLPD